MDASSLLLLIQLLLPLHDGLLGEHDGQEACHYNELRKSLRMDAGGGHVKIHGRKKVEEEEAEENATREAGPGLGGRT